MPVSPYVTQDQVTPLIPPDFLAEALDDDNDGSEDTGLWDDLVTAVSDEVDGTLGQRYATPFADDHVAIGFIRHSTRTLLLEALYLRRGYAGDDNPWGQRAADVRTTLRSIAAGDRPLGPAAERQRDSASAITETARTHNTQGHIPT